MNRIIQTESGFSVVHNGREYKTAPRDCKILRTDGTYASFAEAKYKEKEFHSGAGNGFSRVYSDFNGIPGLVLECRVWIENATGDVIAEMIPLSDAPVREILWPAPFENPEKDAYSVVPMGQGALIPNYTEQVFPDVWPIISWYLEYRYSCSRSMYMQFFGQYDGKGGCMTILETRYDGGMHIDSGKGKPVLCGVRWRESLGRVGYTRRLRIKFFDAGCDYNDLCKSYRSYIDSIGELVSLRQKAAANPKVKELIGRPLIHTYIWYHTVPESKMYREGEPDQNDQKQTYAEIERELKRLKRSGLDRAVIHLDGWGRRGYDNQHPDCLPPAEEFGGWDAMKRFCDTCHELGYFFGTHDQYRDYFYDADSFDEEFAVHNEDGTVHTHAIWMGGKQTFLCATQAPYYVRRNFNELKNHGVYLDNTYLDVFSCVELDECFHPEHPMTREECARQRMKCFTQLAADGILIQSEEGIDWAFPGLVFVHHAPYFTGAEQWSQTDCTTCGIRVPLLHLVYHDCLIMPSMAGSPEAALTGLLTGDASYLELNADKRELDARLAQSAWQAEVQMRELVRHEFVDGDVSRQRTVFADDYSAEVDFAERTCLLRTPEKETRLSF